MGWSEDIPGERSPGDPCLTGKLKLVDISILARGWLPGSGSRRYHGNRGHHRCVRPIQRGYARRAGDGGEEGRTHIAERMPLYKRRKCFLPIFSWGRIEP